MKLEPWESAAREWEWDWEWYVRYVTGPWPLWAPIWIGTHEGRSHEQG